MSDSELSVSTDELCAAKAALPKITHVAIQYTSRMWSLPTPNKHHHIDNTTGKTKWQHNK